MSTCHNCGVRLEPQSVFCSNCGTQKVEGKLDMQKTKMGISVGLLGASLYLVGLINFLGLIILAGYVLLFETNEWLKKSAVKAASIVIGLTLITIFIRLGNDLFNVVNGLISLGNTSFRFVWPLNLEPIIVNAVNALQKVLLLVLGYRALSQSSISISAIDNLVDRNM